METRIESNGVIGIVREALELPAEDRDAYVRAAANGDADLLDELADALRWEERMGNFLQRPLVDCVFIVRPFEPGQVVLDRFEIVREIGQGGMGMVYEAFDRRLQHRVAIKAAKPGFQRLLSPELKSALKVSHHNICREHEIHTTRTEWGEIDFITMEFLDGETLSAHLKKAGRLSHEEAFDIACQLCAGLSEAHQSGIIHRDLKSGNIMLCRNVDGSQRAVITDFGLAGPSSTSGELAGTPAYMAPELWRGEPASMLTDIYALGVILYEMVAGRKPYQHEEDAEPEKQKTVTLTGKSVEEAEDEPASLIQVTQQEWEQPSQTRRPLPPSTWMKGLDPRWDRVIMGCLEVDSAERTQDVGEVLAELRRKRIPKWPFATAGIVVLVLAAAIGLIRPLRLWVMDLIWPPNVRLAVLPYDGPQDLAAVSSGALQDAAERVQQLPTDRKWPLSRLSRTVAVIPPSRLTYLHVTTPQQARDVLHATHALQLTVRHANPAVAVVAAIIDLSADMPVKRLSMQYDEGEAGVFSAALTHFLALTFRLGEPSSEDRLSSSATPAYLNGIYFLNRDIHSFEEAIAQFQQAARLDPNSALPPAGMALALVQKFNSTQQKIYLQQAQEFVRRAQSRNADSTRVLLAAGRVKEANGQWNNALQDYRRIQELEPRNVDVQQRLGYVYEQLDEPDEALMALRKAQELDPDYYRSHQLMGEFYSRRGRYQEAAEQFEKTVARAPGFFDAYSSLGGMLIELERFPEAEDALKKSLAIRETPMALNNLGALMCFEGRYEEAAAYQRRALVYQPNDVIYIMNIGDNLRWGGHRSEAMPYYGRGRELTLAEMTAEPKAADVRALFAYFSMRVGDRTRAEQEIKEAINSAPGDGDVRRFAVLTYEGLGERGLAIEAARGMTPAQLKHLTREPDLADFCRDPRFIQQMTDKGGQ